MVLPKVLSDLLALPTAAFCESAVARYLDRVCRPLAGVTIQYDRYGNLLAHYRHRPRKSPPLAFVAHMDHPAFVAQEMPDGARLRAAFRGGVRPEYFRNAKVRFWTARRWVRGRVLEVTKVGTPAGPGASGRPEETLIRVSRPVQPGSPGTWDLPGPVLRGDRVAAPACDDLAGVAAVVSLLQRLSRDRARGEVYCLFTRAEELGFIGAIGAARAGTLPKSVPVVSIETSSALPHAPVGAGPIVRVGDRATVFDPELTAFCVRVAQSLAQHRKRFVFQRRLMDGGMCEATAFGAYGYRATGICLALGNYHNMDVRRRKIAREYISLADWCGIIDLFEALVRDELGPQMGEGSTRVRLDERFEKHEQFLLEPGH